MKKVQSTVWLDILTYILLPIVVVIGVWNTLRVMRHIDWDFFEVSMMLVEIALLVFYGYTAYYTHKRDKKAYLLLQILFWVTALRASIDFANTRMVNNQDNFLIEFCLYLGICYLAWILPNNVYLQKRKAIFKEELPAPITKETVKKVLPKKKTVTDEDSKKKEVDS